MRWKRWRVPKATTALRLEMLWGGFPSVAPRNPSQRWALGRNPFGIPARCHYHRNFGPGLRRYSRSRTDPTPANAKGEGSGAMIYVLTVMEKPGSL